MMIKRRSINLYTKISMALPALLMVVLPVLFATASAQKMNLERVEPAFWWTNMHYEEVQLMVYGHNIGTSRVRLSHPGVRLKQVRQVENPNYLFVDVVITDSAKSGTFPVTFYNNKHSETYIYELKKRNLDRSYAQGFDAGDVIYLMMPDRFANGNPRNDSVKGMLEKADRSDPNARQGGDIEGVMEHLEYIKKLGMTAIWFTPIIENDMPASYGAYHGYAATDLYRVDRRFGTNEQYRQLVEKTHENGMKVIMDMIHNHIGDHHWWMDDLPTDDWLHSYEKYGNTSYRGVVASDPYASQYDMNQLEKGWFVREMPDLNQDNELLATYLKQNTIWWIEYAGIDGIRMDTYVYPDKEYMAEWADYVLKAYPDFNIVGEAWVNGIAMEAYWQEGDKMSTGYESNLPNVTDFPMQSAFAQSFNTEASWLGGLNKVYYTLAQDFVYSDPMKNVIFLDNHDLTRFYTQVGERKWAFKAAYAMLMTTRGIPQVYYGTELMFKNLDLPKDAGKRQTMPGGWPDDDRSVFTEKGRTDLENEIFDYVTQLTNWRKTQQVIHNGRLTQFLADNNVYVYFRHTEKKAVMVAVNASEEARTLDKNRYDEILGRFESGLNVITNAAVHNLTAITVPARDVIILELE